jgi:hypothetical protein
MNTDTTSAKNLQTGDRFHVAGRKGMGELVHTAISIEDESPRTRIVTTADRTIRMAPHAKVWIEVEG